MSTAMGVPASNRILGWHPSPKIPQCCTAARKATLDSLPGSRSQTLFDRPLPRLRMARASGLGLPSTEKVTESTGPLLMIAYCYLLLLLLSTPKGTDGLSAAMQPSCLVEQDVTRAAARTCSPLRWIFRMLHWLFCPTEVPPPSFRPCSLQPVFLQVPSPSRF